MDLARLREDLHILAAAPSAGSAWTKYSSLTSYVAVNRGGVLACDGNVDTPFADDETLITCAMSSCSFLSHFTLEEKRADDDALGTAVEREFGRVMGKKRTSLCLIYGL